MGLGVDSLNPCFCCSQCQLAVRSPLLPLISKVRYRQIEELPEIIPDLLLLFGEEHIPQCESCKQQTLLFCLDYHCFQEQKGQDLVIRYLPSLSSAPAQYQLFWWHPEQGYTKISSLTQQEKAAFKRDALIRALSCATAFGEDNPLAVGQEALQALPEDPLLLGMVPSLHQRGLTQLCQQITEAYLRYQPQDPNAYILAATISLAHCLENLQHKDGIHNSLALANKAKELAPDDANIDVLIEYIEQIKTGLGV